MIKGVGTDIVEVARIERSLGKGEKFKQLVFHQKEIEYCESRGKSLLCYAGRFAAKEALVKALGTGLRGELKFSEMYFLNDDMGKPCLVLEGKTAQSLSAYGQSKFHVSISHTEHYATAFVIIEE